MGFYTTSPFFDITNNMKKLLVSFLIFCPVVANADFWFCSLEDTVEKIDVSLTFAKNDGQYFIYFEDYKLPLSKTFENDEYIHLVMSDGDSVMANVINKKTGDIKSGFLSMNTEYQQSLSQGRCIE